jgi:hypothetical protein
MPQNPEYLDRPEPIRIPKDKFRWVQNRTGKAYREAGLFQDSCLARAISQAKGFNTASTVTRNASTYDGERVFEDGTKERLVGCMSCGAMCTLLVTAGKDREPVAKENPNQVISIAEAPVPNPWMELGNFGDCKLGEVKLPEPVEGLTTSLGLSEEQALLAKYHPAL